jgi:hypothetical protein
VSVCAQRICELVRATDFVPQSAHAVQVLRVSGLLHSASSGPPRRVSRTGSGGGEGAPDMGGLGLGFAEEFVAADGYYDNI